MERTYAGVARALPMLRPLVARLGAKRLEKPMAAVEHAVKGLLFDCGMCGGCALSGTGMACPINCPKRVRNGPCGGVRADGYCEVKPEMRCVWVEGWEGSQRMSGGTLPIAGNPPIENDRIGMSSWLPLVTPETMPARRAPGVPSQGTPAAASTSGSTAASTTAPTKVAAVAPAIGAGDGTPAAPATGRRPVSQLEALLTAGTFVVTAEFPPPDSADPGDVFACLEHFRGHVDAVNVTDASGANCHMSSLAVSALLLQSGCEPVMQVTCRDRNRIAIQGDLLGAAALGIRNVLCLTGDDVRNGDHPGARGVWDLDSVTLLAMARAMCDEAHYWSGRKLTVPPKLFLGGADNPFAPPFEARPNRLARKVAAGARFVQTQYCFDVERLERYMETVRAEGLHERVHVIVGVGPIASAKTARWLRTKVPGVHIPDAIVGRLEKASDPRAEGRRICVELIQKIRAIPGVAGIHLMATRQESAIGGIVAESGVLAGRLPAFSTAAANPPLQAGTGPTPIDGGFRAVPAEGAASAIVGPLRTLAGEAMPASGPPRGMAADATRAPGTLRGAA